VFERFTASLSSGAFITYSSQPCPRGESRFRRFGLINASIDDKFVYDTSHVAFRIPPAVGKELAEPPACYLLKSTGCCGLEASLINSLAAHGSVCSGQTDIAHIDHFILHCSRMDPLSLSASIAGLISITDMIAGRSYKCIKEARGASKEVKKLLEEITDLFGILNSLRLVASRYQDEPFDSTLQSQHIHTCHTLLEKIKDRLDKADPSQVDETKSSFRQKASTLGRILIWPFSSAETKGLIAEVANQKATLSLALAADGMNTLIESLSQQKAQGEDIAEIRENVRAQRAEQALSLLSMSTTPLTVSIEYKLKYLAS